MKKVNFDDFAENYDDILKGQTQFFSKDDKYFARYKIEIVKNYINFKPNTILEFGCGTGRNMQFLREKFPDSKLFGTDISQKSIEIAKSQHPYCEFFTLDDQKTDKSFYQFDLIFVAGVFHHIHPAERLINIEKIKNLLSDNGCLFIFEHNPYNPITRKLVRECPFDKDAVLLTKSEMIKLLERSNFKVDKAGYYLFIPPKFSYLLKLEKILIGLPLGGQYFVKASKRY
jgi:SAM-dependent methyltransferase